jgi:putative transposase
MLIFNEVKKRWYAHISSYIVIERDTNSGYKCGIDLGQKILATVATENGHVFMYKGSRLAWDYQYFKKRVSMNDKLFDLDELDRDYWLEKRKKYYYKRRKRVDEAYKNLSSHLVKTLKQLGIVEIYVGYPHNIAKDKPTENNVSFWSYWKLMTRIALTAENYGIAVYAVNENNTSQYCAYHGIKGQRSPRGLLHCPMGHIIHSDINAALNILKKAGGKLPTTFKTQSFIVTPRRVRPVK